MIEMTLDQLAGVVGGQVHGDPAVVVNGPAYLDSRSPEAGGLFVAVAGDRVDGHEFAAGAHAVLGTRATAAPTVVVPDSVAALGRLARHVIDALDVPVTALTGSQGKTGTKDLLAAVLAADAETVATSANLNNELGVPLTALRATPSTTHLVLEMGARGVGHIAYLCGIAPPRVAAVLNVGSAHVGEFGGVEAIARAKGEIVEALPPDGVAVLNADDARVAAMASRTDARVLTFGSTAEVTWRDLTLDELGRPAFELGHDGAWAAVRLRGVGAHQVANAAAAAALALASGLRLDDIASALTAARSTSRWRMELDSREDGLLVLNDAYNANPASMTAAVEALAALGRSRSGRTIAVLGEMRELGDAHDAGHREVGRTAAARGIDVVVVVGESARPIADGVAESGRGATHAVVTAGRDDALAWVRNNAGADDTVLVKASRGAALEWIAEQVLTDPAEGGTRSR
ncbi:UDP-N-acetylmuramoyl-tripeptide--D-alanyl-D-alanine ligase [Nocardioides sp. R-C-SC26]|uniref:UDP-N-acetylmuramoyl-tripeptide--D-alanyl-D- alanine ligase n=1 Tax=Nocardioides sp. R-C-SC26 TaxID=2870414 RepID=UPI001E2DC3E1|nr:UDP-N-acetylmuramoyl-tripeptide--D-alanyl-D-alanine ligase [Nocardioides sp. R-C-SC26]